MPWTVVALSLGEMVLLGLVIVVVAVRLQERARLRFELQARLVERFSSPAELQQFLESDGGRRLIESLSPSRSPALRILLTIQAGIVLLVVGVALVFVAPAHGEAAGGQNVIAAGEITAALGLGLLVAAVVTRRLSRAWGLEADAAVALESATSRADRARGRE
jgi:hypothetical protein